MSLDIPGEYGETMEQSAKRVHAKMLVFVSPEDYMVNPEPAVALANALGAPVVMLESECGHVSSSCISVGPSWQSFSPNPGPSRRPHYARTASSAASG